jgi:hypothetical protein
MIEFSDNSIREKHRAFDYTTDIELRNNLHAQQGRSCVVMMVEIRHPWSG